MTCYGKNLMNEVIILKNSCNQHTLIEKTTVNVDYLTDRDQKSKYAT